MEINGWQVPDRFEPGDYLKNEFIVTPDGKKAILVYNFKEFRMGWYFANLVVFEDKENSRLVLNEPAVSVSAPATPIAGFLNDGRYAYFRSEFTKKVENSLLTMEIPVVLLDMLNFSFALIPMKDGIYYECTDISPSKVALKKNQINDHFPNRDGETIDLALLKWFPKDELKNMGKLYWNL